MSAAKADRVRLVDAEDEAGRTTASLVGSLAARLLALHYTSGVSVVGSLIAGLAALGREASRTAEGALIRQALERGPAVGNGDAVWSAMRIGDWASGLPASPVLDHVRNDLALLLAKDLEETLEQPFALPEARPRSVVSAEAPVPVTSIDCLVGLWVYSREIVRAVEALAGPTLAPGGKVEHPARPEKEPEGTLLR